MTDESDEWRSELEMGESLRFGCCFDLLLCGDGHQYVGERKEEDCDDRDDEHRCARPVPVDEGCSDAAIDKHVL